MNTQFKIPKSFKDPLKLFHIVINNVLSKNKEDEYLTHGQMANVVFNNGNAIHQSYLSIVTNSFGDYLIRYRNKYKFDLSTIKEHFPSFFGLPLQPENILKEINTAIKHEKSAVFKKRIGRIIYVTSYDAIGENAQFYFYNLYLKLETEETLKIFEGMNIKLAIDKKRYFVTALDMEEGTGKLTIRSSTDLNSDLESKKRTRIVIDAGWMLNKLEECLIDFPENKLPISKLLQESWQPNVIDLCNCFYKGVLDDSQEAAIKNCLKHDLTAIWGPPGTGKSTTLGYLLLELFKRKERTLVCSIANVAVDSVLKICLAKFSEYEKKVKPINFRNGNILRVGYSKDELLKDNDDIKIESKEVRAINYKLKKIKNKLLDKGLSDEVTAKLKSNRIDLLEKMESEKKRIINQASLIFATASKIEIDTILNTLDIDNIVIDEASMMSAPHLLAIAKNTNKRIIIAGDFRQLGPIAISQSALAYKWLHTDLFQFFGINYDRDEITHPALSMIVNQRRFHDSICKLINEPFYQFNLKTKTDIKELKLYKQKPIKEKTILYYDLSKNEDYKTDRTKEQSRYNLGSMKFVIDKIIKPLKKHPLRTPFHITIITPYKGQVNQYNIALKSQIKNDDFLSRIQVGTVHSFQGSQSDLIIFDIVDSMDEKIGRLYWQNKGERLLNVAISRATGKLIFVGDIQTLISGKGYMNVSRKVSSLLRKIESHRIA